MFGGVNEELLVGIGQGFRMNAIVGLVELRLSEGSLVHTGQGMMAYCAANARLETRGNAKWITKAASKGKVDPLMAVLDAAECMALAPAPIDVDAMIAPA